MTKDAALRNEDDAPAPLAEVDLLLEDLGSDSTRAPAVPRPGDGRAVLVVDSVPIARKYLLHRLEAQGYEVHCADNGERALAMVERMPYAVVFVEVMLEGGLDGLGLCQAIKQMRNPPGGSTPAVVVATGQASSTNRVRGSLAGCDAYMNKPLLEHELLATLRNVDPLFDLGE